MSKDDRKTEASMPVQSRVDLKTLAELAVYWEKQGMYITTMSRLVAWSLDALRMILDRNGQIKYKIDTLELAYDVLESKNMLQASMKKKMESKFEKSRAMENIRFEGWDEREVGDKFYEDLHPDNEVQPFPIGKTRLTKEQRNEMNRLLAIGDEARRKKQDEEVERQKANAIKNNPRILDIDEKGLKKNYETEDHLSYVEENRIKNEREKDKSEFRGEYDPNKGKYGKSLKGGIYIDTDRNMELARQRDKEIMEDDMMPPAATAKVNE